jgi:Family of unknown function (DUF6125)
MKDLGRDELKEIILKCWMSHDGSWFYHCFHEFGIEAANRLNKAAIKSLAQIELPRIARALEIDISGAPTPEMLREVVDGAFSVVKGDFMYFDYRFISQDQMEWTMKRCFAFEGMKRLGLEDGYECGLLYRVGAWVQVLGIDYEIAEPINGCMMNEKGFCANSVKFRF